MRLEKKLPNALAKLGNIVDHHGCRRTSNLGVTVNFLPEFPIVCSEIFPKRNGFLPNLGGAAASLPPSPTLMLTTMLANKFMSINGTHMFSSALRGHSTLK